MIIGNSQLTFRLHENVRISCSDQMSSGRTSRGKGFSGRTSREDVKIACYRHGMILVGVVS